ncbi:phage tail tube protein [Anaplasma platys]|uniref:phage tail tube protein n=1 Tax=Anaplasma platys TaxID=949 RepID=UPI00145EC26C|nr:phage tail tube protein [Anaplasma platys]
MISVKIKGEDNESTHLRNMKGVKLSFHNKIPKVRGPYTKGWRTFIEESGDRHITINIRGILSNSKAESILGAAALHNAFIFCEITLQSFLQEVISAKFFVELYEKDCAVGELEYFSIILVSHGVVEYETLRS